MHHWNGFFPRARVGCHEGEGREREGLSVGLCPEIDREAQERTLGSLPRAALLLGQSIGEGDDVLAGAAPRPVGAVALARAPIYVEGVRVPADDDSVGTLCAGDLGPRAAPPAGDRRHPARARVARPPRDPSGLAATLQGAEEGARPRTFPGRIYRIHESLTLDKAEDD